MLYSSSTGAGKLRDESTAHHVESMTLSFAALRHPFEGGLTTIFWFLDTNERLMRINLISRAHVLVYKAE